MEFMTSPLFKKISRLADYFLISLLWLVFSLPIITAAPAAMALYHTTAKIMRYDSEDSVFPCFWDAFRQNIKQGILLSLLYAAAIMVLYTFLDVSRYFGMGSLFSKVYIPLMILYGVLLLLITLFLIPVLSRFSMKIFHGIRLSLRFVREHFGKSLLFFLALVGTAALCYLIPPLSLVLPSIFCYSLSSLTEPVLKEYFYEFTDETMEIPYWLEEAWEE